MLGFGRRMTWTTDLVVPPGHQMTFKDALQIFSTNLILKFVLPGWAKYFSKHARKIDLAFIELKVCYHCYPELSYCALVTHAAYLEQQYMVEMVEGRRHADQVERRYDLFSGLLDATQDEPGSEAALDDDELIGEYIKLRSFGILGRMS
jgi:hypothetical protein